MVVNMEQIPCIYCGDFFDPSPRHKNQSACKKTVCQNAKRAAWQRYKLKHDPVYRANQKSSQQQWLAAAPGYWKVYRKKNPEKAQRNRILQQQRNRKARCLAAAAKMNASLTARLDLSKSDNFQILGQFKLVSFSIFNEFIKKLDFLSGNMI